MITVNIHEAKTHLSRLLRRVAAGEEILIAKAGRPLARLVPVKRRPEARVPGTAAGRIVVRDDFDAPLPDGLLEELDEAVASEKSKLGDLTKDIAKEKGELDKFRKEAASYTDRRDKALAAVKDLES